MRFTVDFCYPSINPRVANRMSRQYRADCKTCSWTGEWHESKDAAHDDQREHEIDTMDGRDIHDVRLEDSKNVRGT